MAGIFVCSMVLGADAFAWTLFDKKPKEEKIEAGKIPSVATVTNKPLASSKGDTAESRTVSRAHMRFDDPQEEKQLMTLIAARRRAQEDFVVVSRLIEEKQLEIRTFNEQMQKEFGVSMDKNYQFDAESGTIFELVLKAGADLQKNQQTVNADQLKDIYDFNVHRKLTDEKEKTRFLRLAAGKQLAGDQIKMLSLLQNEKEIENQTVHDEMARRYAISLDREYRYDSDTKTLFELVTIPSDYVEPAKTDASVKRK